MNKPVGFWINSIESGSQCGKDIIIQEWNIQDMKFSETLAKRGNLKLMIWMEHETHCCRSPRKESTKPRSGAKPTTTFALRSRHSIRFWGRVPHLRRTLENGHAPTTSGKQGNWCWNREGTFSPIRRSSSPSSHQPWPRLSTLFQWRQDNLIHSSNKSRPRRITFW